MAVLNKSVRILDFDGSLTKQGRLLFAYSPEVVDLRMLEPQVRLWMAAGLKNKFLARLKGSRTNAITFLGSGDFHHITQFLIEEYQSDTCLIVFDFHPDWDIFPPAYGCGSWVTQAMRNKRIKKAVLLGVSSNDISTFSLQSADLSSLKDNRLEIYPYSHQPSLVFFRKVPENISIKTKGGSFCSKINWSQLKGQDLGVFMQSLARRMPVKKVYISIDKDCLKGEHSLTNWESGYLSLGELLLMLKVIKENLDIVGVDITGDYSKVSFPGRIKSFFSRLDHPTHIAAENHSSPVITSLNEKTNLKILQLLVS